MGKQESRSIVSRVKMEPLRKPPRLSSSQTKINPCLSPLQNESRSIAVKMIRIVSPRENPSTGIISIDRRESLSLSQKEESRSIVLTLIEKRSSSIQSMQHQIENESRSILMKKKMKKNLSSSRSSLSSSPSLRKLQRRQGQEEQEQDESRNEEKNEWRSMQLCTVPSISEEAVDTLSRMPGDIPMRPLSLEESSSPWDRMDSRCMDDSQGQVWSTSTHEDISSIRSR